MAAAHSRLLKILQISAAVLLCAIAAFVAGCVQGARDDQSVDPLWSTVIAAHTSGPISKKGDIRIVFNHDVIAPEQIGREATKLLSSKPRIAGKVQFVSRRELVWTPSEELKRGRSYRLELSPRGLIGVPATLSNYTFAVQVQAPEFEVRLDPLQAGAEEKELRLSGYVLTADVEAADRV
jgi:hypothetical protein